LRFAEGIGVARDDVKGAERNEATQALVDLYAELSREAKVPAAVAALYAYERQVPQTAGSKIEGLKAHYGVDDPQTLGFFTVHGELDVEHSGAEREMLGGLLADGGRDDAEVEDATRRTLDAWWNFLSAVDSEEPARAAA
jgi:pyrroloquinoline-quinone synthase